MLYEIGSLMGNSWHELQSSNHLHSAGIGRVATMMDDPIVEEVHRIREELLAKYGGDLHALIADAQRRTEEAARAGRKVVSPDSHKLKPSIESAKKVVG